MVKYNKYYLDVVFLYDLHVIGAGPAGLSSAISATTKRNARVLVSDFKEKAGSDVVCSGLFSNNVYSSVKNLRANIEKAKLWPIYGSQVHVAGVDFEVRKQMPIANVFDRSKFDYILYERALNEGVTFEFGKRITTNFKSHNLIAADGPTSSISRTFGLPPIKKYALAGQFLAPNSLTYDLVHTFVDPGVIPGFFGWVIPHNKDIAEYGAGVDLSYGLNPRNVLQRFISKYFHSLGDISRYNPSFALIPIGLRSQTSVIDKNKGHKLIVVGDAAGQTKSSTGGGVILNTQIGQIAGKYFDNPSLYDKLWKKNFLLTFKLHNQINKMFHKSPSRLRAMVESMKDRGLERFLSTKGDMDYPHRWFTGFNLLEAIYIFGPHILSII